MFPPDKLMLEGVLQAKQPLSSADKLSQHESPSQLSLLTVDIPS